MWRTESKSARRLTAIFGGVLMVAAFAAAPLWKRGTAGGRLPGAIATAAPQSRAEGKKRIVDGAHTPDQIPDHVAYAMVFRVVADRHSEGAKRNVRSYIAQLGVGRQACGSCPDKAKKKAPHEPDEEIEAVVQAAEEYHRQVSALDLQAKAIKDATWQNPTAESRAQLAELQGQKEALVKSVAATLEGRLGPDATARLRHSLKERVKRLTKIRVS